MGEARRGNYSESVLTAPFEEFARAHLPPPPARVLEVGCGRGELTTALAVAGYDVLGIDPLAPLGDRFRRILLEDLDHAHEFDAVVAARSLHPLRDLSSGLDRIAALLRPGGVLVVDELAWDLIDEPTFDWLYGQRRALASAGRGEAPASVDELRAEWEAGHLGVHGFATLQAALSERFEEREFVWTPFLHRILGGVATEVLEQALIDANAIRALGFRYAGVRI
jgi:SAM-dependent methyltransferase